MLLAFDTETMPTQPGLAAPPIVCFSFATQDGRVELVDAETGLDELEACLDDTEIVFITHNGFYDFACACAARPRLIPKVFQAYADNRMRDTMIRAMLVAIALGKMKEDGQKRKDMFTLETLAAELCGIVLEKDDAVRLTYGKLLGIPISQWPAAHVEYAKKDAVATLRVYEAQCDQADDYVDPIAVNGIPHAVYSEPHECRSAWALQLMRVHGVRTDKAAIDQLEIELRKDFDKVDKIVRAAGLVRTAGNNELVRKKNKATGQIVEKWRTIPKGDDGSRNMGLIYQRVTQAYVALGLPVPKTETGRVSTEAEVLEESLDPVLEALAERGGYEKILSTYIPALRMGERYALNAFWNVLVSSTRTSCGDPNLQNPPRKQGVRECIVARPGHVICSVDYDTVELRALADFCEKTFGHSAMADAIRAGLDLHTKLAARLLGISYEEAVKKKKTDEVKGKRDLAKAVNFGRPGGMGDVKFRATAKKQQGLVIGAEEAATLKREWLAEFPEMRQFFAYVSRLTQNGEATIKTPGSGILRGGCSYTASCNQHFQGPVAFAAKKGLFYVSWECYVDHGTALFGCRPALFVHDEIDTEMREEVAAAASKRQTEIMTREAQSVFDVPITASPALMYRLSKSADAAYINGELVAWERACIYELVRGLQAVVYGAPLETAAPTEDRKLAA